MSGFATVIPVLLGMLSAQIALGIMTPLVPLLLVGHGSLAPQIGLIASAYSAGFMAGAITAERIVIRVGHIRAFAAFAALAANATLIMSATDAPLTWAILRAIIGYCSAGLCLVAESWLNGQADNASRGRIFGAYLVASWAGGAIGPLAMNLVPATAWLFLPAAIAFTSALVPLALTRQDNPVIGRQARMGLLALYRISPVGLACCLAAGLVNGVFYALGPVYLARFHYDPSQVAAFVSAANIAGLAVQWPIGLLSDRLGRRWMAVVVLGLGLLVSLVFIATAHVSVSMLLIMGCAFAGVAAPLYGLGAGQTNDRLERGDAVAASGGLLFAWAMGAAIGPALAGAVMGVLGPNGLFIYMAIVLATVTLFTVQRMRIREEVPRDQRGGFVPAMTEPAVHAELATPSEAQ
jgi:MFS family permease